MLNSLARSSVSKVMDPIGRGLLKAGLTPDIVTIVGTVGVVAGSVALLATGYLFAGTMVVTFFVLCDLVDGAMARARGYGTDFGVVLDASCDRIADGALFGALTFYAFSADQRLLGIAALICLVSGQVISYVKARADSVQLAIGGALAERAERNVLGLVGAGLAGLGVPYALDVALWLLAVGRSGDRGAAAGAGPAGRGEGGRRARSSQHGPAGAMSEACRAGEAVRNGGSAVSQAGLQ